MIDKRAIVLRKATAKYIKTGITRNITEALRLYLENDAGPDEQVPLFISSPEIDKIRKILEHIRPTCDECSSELHLQVNARDPKGKLHPTAWVCTKCSVVYYSELTPTEWLLEIQLETRIQKLRHPDEPGAGELPIVRKISEI